MDEDQKIEYETTSECFRHNQNLIHQGIATYIALAAPLAAVAVADSFAWQLRFLASIVGILVSGLWFLIANRLSIYTHTHFERMKLLEGANAGFALKDEALKNSNFWLKTLPGTTNTIIFTYLFCGACFVGLAVFILCVR